MRSRTIGYTSRVRTTVSLPEPLLEKAKQYATERGVTLSVVVEDALRRLITRTAVAAGPKFRLHTVRGRLVNPNLDLDRTSALVVRDDEESLRAKRR
jgi:hypothetical protein